jgi:TPR repeat protein
MSIVANAPLVVGDAASGRSAFEKGDYVQAMSEWQSAADHGDDEAQFGLGSLYEFGSADLKQDYKRADYWYQKSAAQNNAEAQYRLALIWAAGSDEFLPDLAEAYKWVFVATESKGVWSTLATDLKVQLDRVTTPGLQIEGRQRAAAWKEEHKPNQDKVVPMVPAQPTAPAGKPGVTGCPGWPFPTLPCTEQFPSLPGQSAAQRPQ